jgi:hypothetical protein
MSWMRTRAGASAITLVCAVAGVLAIAGPANAASRGYQLHNMSRHSLKVESVKPIPVNMCSPHLTFCVPTHFEMEFEGRPDVGDVLHRGSGSGPHVWDLKWYLGYTYAARLTYAIEGMKDATVEYTIETSTYSNNSTCKVIPASAGHCSAEGLLLQFKNP